jgi:flavin-dependent dehydrogenase
MANSADVLIAGGGLAGLTLAHQLKTEQPDLDILVLEKNRFPVPSAIAKVGESTVEIGSHYLEHTIGVGEHLRKRHLRKFGLRCFFGGSTQNFAEHDELGSSDYFGIPTYQLDRGVLENHLHEQVLDLGVRVKDGIDTLGFEAGGNNHTVFAKDDTQELRFHGHWVLDASGRRGLLRKHFALGVPSPHKGNALWFRVRRRVEIDRWTTDPTWHARCRPQQQRWLSTNHLMGAGYWVWIIPLYDNITSIGIVMDDQVLTQAPFNSAEQALAWLKVNQPCCADALEGAEIMDYVKAEDYSFGAKQVFSSSHWGMTGEAGVFADPFYSPGSDFIAINNRYLVELVKRERKGMDITLDTAIFQKLYESIFASTLSLYTGEYGAFGHRRTMSVKVLWDFAYYWGVLALLAFRGMLTNLPLMREANQPLLGVRQLNAQLQARFREWAQQREVQACKGVFVDQYQAPILRLLNSGLQRQSTGDGLAELKDNIRELSALAAVLISVLDNQPVSDSEQALLGEYGRHCR